MKTRVANFSNLIFPLILCLGLASCNKEDFYEKEYLDNPFQDPTTEGPVDGGSQGGVDSGNSGGTQGGVDSGVDGGSATGGTTSGSTTGSSTTGGNTDGGVDGSTTSGSTGGTTGGVDGGVDGSTTSGSTGGTTGGVDGGVDGSTTSGSTGGTTGGDTTGGSTGGYESHEETFHQSESQTKKLDIVWIIDNSGSMSDEQADLGSNFSAFIDEFITKDVDFKMAITTTDTSSSDKKGKMVYGSDVKLTSAKAQENEAQFKADFTSLVKVGIRGSGSEKGLAASEGFMQKYSSTFLRSDAYLAVVVLSDEEDQSEKNVKFYTDYLKTFKNEAGLVKIYTIADINKTNTGYGIATGADRYIEASNQTAGVVSNIRDDFYMSLAAMGDSIINLLDSFALAHAPVTGSLKVFVNGVETTDYTYDSGSRSIKFNPNNLPPVGAEIKVTYLK